MIEMIGKMALCLIVVLLFGFLIGWFFSRALKSEKSDIELDGVENIEDNRLKELEKLYSNEKRITNDYSKKNRELKGELMKKVNLLKDTSLVMDELRKSSSQKDKNIGRVNELEMLLERKESELREFETVLIKAEDMIEKLRGNG